MIFVVEAWRDTQSIGTSGTSALINFRMNVSNTCWVLWERCEVNITFTWAIFASITHWSNVSMYLMYLCLLCIYVSNQYRWSISGISVLQCISIVERGQFTWIPVQLFSCLSRHHLLSKFQVRGYAWWLVTSRLIDFLGIYWLIIKLYYYVAEMSSSIFVQFEMSSPEWEPHWAPLCWMWIKNPIIT